MRRFSAVFLVLLICSLVGFHVSAQQEANFQVIEALYPPRPEVLALLQVAEGELGYSEDSAGRTKYGAWYGDAAAEWCAEYLCWSVAQVEKQLNLNLLQVQFPLYGATNIGRDWFIKEGRYIARTGFVDGWGSQWLRGQSLRMERNSYIPQPGDWVFFSYTPSGDTTHVAMVEKVLRLDDGRIMIQVFEGNMPDRVQRARYSLDDWRILGYGTVWDLADIALRGGNEGLKVKRLQENLMVIGLLNTGDDSGKYDHKTQEAVRSFQAMSQLPQTGIANQETQISLFAFTSEWINSHTEFWQVDDNE